MGRGKRRPEAGPITAVPGAVGAGGSVTINAAVSASALATWYLAWDVNVAGVGWLTDRGEYSPVTELTVLNQQPGMTYIAGMTWLASEATGAAAGAQSASAGTTSAGGDPRCFRGGRYRDLTTGNGIEVHHMPANSVSPLSRLDGPAIQMERLDHWQTGSWGRSNRAQEYQAEQKRLIDEGCFDDAIQMDIDDVTSKFPGKYDQAILNLIDGL